MTYAENAARVEATRSHGGPPVQQESLAQVAKRLRAKLRDRSVEVASEIVTMSENWEEWKERANGKTFGKWLRTITRKPLSYFRELTLQVTRHKRLKTNMLTKVDSNVIYWARNGTDEELVSGSVAVSASFHQGGGVLLSRAQVSRIMPEIVRAASPRGKSVEMELRARIGRLIQQIRSLGAEPVE
jgi:hypothetical protein